MLKTLGSSGEDLIVDDHDSCTMYLVVADRCPSLPEPSAPRVVSYVAFKLRIPATPPHRGVLSVNASRDDETLNFLAQGVSPQTHGVGCFIVGTCSEYYTFYHKEALVYRPMCSFFRDRVHSRFGSAVAWRRWYPEHDLFVYMDTATFRARYMHVSPSRRLYRDIASDGGDAFRWCGLGRGGGPARLTCSYSSSSSSAPRAGTFRTDRIPRPGGRIPPPPRESPASRRRPPDGATRG